MGLVVEHLFEVGCQPLIVDRITVKTAADLIVNAALGHGVQVLAHGG